MLSCVPFVFLGNSDFGLNNHFMKSYPFTKITREERMFNYKLSTTRRVLENSFGILSSRFRDNLIADKDTKVKGLLENYSHIISTMRGKRRFRTV
ncbi:hypothetical protein PR048_013558 [Dryococelus australis]|uniref:DDE Tnp4 domain-containing protein n=1 Tax=Dryococelus australis TaxID=614101 RepID=A0ABQ9HSI8_9NEOP|nr:hypothetical protein PR048_013558 [Dryococelus australis]